MQIAKSWLSPHKLNQVVIDSSTVHLAIHMFVEPLSHQIRFIRILSRHEQVAKRNSRIAKIITILKGLDKDELPERRPGLNQFT